MSHRDEHSVTLNDDDGNPVMVFLFRRRWEAALFSRLIDRVLTVRPTPLPGRRKA